MVPQSKLRAGLAQLEADDVLQGLATLIEEWRSFRDPRLANAIDKFSEQLLTQQIILFTARRRPPPFLAP